MSWEYKCVGAPERPKRRRGVRSPSERVALAMQEIIEAEAVDGWEYLRTDLIPVEEKPGFFSRAQEVHRAVLVFRREAAAVRRVREVEAGPRPAESPPAEERGEPRIPLSAERDTPAPAPPRPTRPPSGLG